MKLKGHEYRVLPMPPREEFHVMRRMTPLVGTMGESIFALLDKSQDRTAVMAKLAAMIGPLTDVLATLPDPIVDYVLDTCLCYVERAANGNGWFPIYVRQQGGAKSLRMFEDIDVISELRLVAEVMRVNLSGFFEQLSGEGASSLGAQT